MSAPLGPATRAVRAGHGGGQAPRTVSPPIQKGSTVLMGSAAELYDDGLVTYGRGGLSTQAALGEALAELEGASGVRLFPSGLAAMTAAMTAVLQAGDEVLITDGVYKPTRRYADRVLGRFGVATRYFAPDAEPEDVIARAGPATRLIVLESPASLTMEMQDVGAIARLARERGLLTVMDNTWGAGLIFRPLEHGVDLSVQSLTKYVGGCSDAFMGSVATRDPALAQALDETVWDFGWSTAAEDAFLMLRGLRSLPARIARCGQSSLEVAAWLADHPAVHSVLHPALPGAPGHGHWARDYEGAAGLFGLVLKPLPPAQVEAFLDRLQLFGLGFSWGGFESLALHADPQLGVRARPPILPGPLIRLNIGLEDPADLIADLDEALAGLPASGEP